MRVCYYTDVHWSQNSSIVRGRGEKYSKRLENLIQSVNWAEELAYDCNCSAVICGGDFFDSPQLNSEEISALKEVIWAPISHVFLTGNHESNVSNLEFSTTDIFSLCPNSVVMSYPQQYVIEGTNNVEFCFLPYVLERDRKPLVDYFGNKSTDRIIFSHNDIKDVQYGQFISTEGFSVSEIESACDLFINGHIHHCGYVTEKIINGGNLTGQNFTEDATKFEHCALIIDTDTMSVSFYKNPHALNFYKIDFTKSESFESEFEKMIGNQLKTNSVITIKVMQENIDYARKLLSNCPSNVSEYRIITEHQNVAKTEEIEVVDTNSSDHLQKFKEFVLNNIGNNEIVVEELKTILG